MRNLIGPSWLGVALLLALMGLAAGCGDDSEIITQELDCMLDGFEGGSYLFAVDSVTESCPLGIANQFVGQQFGPVVLPATDQLPGPPTVIPDVPVIGDLEVVFSTDGQSIQVAGTDQIQLFYPGIGNITATAYGVLCPRSASRVDGQISVQITSPVSCTVSALTIGTLE